MYQTDHQRNHNALEIRPYDDRMIQLHPLDFLIHKYTWYLDFDSQDCMVDVSLSIDIHL